LDHDGNRSSAWASALRQILFEEQTFRFAADAFAEEGQETRRSMCRSSFPGQGRCSATLKASMTPVWKTLILLTVTMETVRLFGLPGEVEIYAQNREVIRTRVLGAQETDPTVDPYRTFLLIGENATVSDAFLNSYTRGASSTRNGLNMVA